MEFITYSLKGNNEQDFYEQLSAFSTKIISEAKHYFSTEITDYKTYLKNTGITTVNSDEEYLIEFIASGTYLEKYASYAMSSGKVSTSILYNLYLLRKKISFTKPVADFLRGHLAGWLLYSLKLRTYEISSEVFLSLIKWLKATGEFNEEIKRLESWSRYYESLHSGTAQEILSKSVAFAKYFEEQSRLQLGRFTYNVNYFLKNEHKKYKNREDYFLCGRSEAEYHLNMFGAEILNRNLCTNFNDTIKKVVLLPSCMSSPEKGKCKAIVDGPRKKCTSCSRNCKINNIQISLKTKGTETYIIEHSSNFSDSLKFWKNQNNTGLVGVACVLNLLKGGYEMQSLNIPSQCVFLDYCGCKKHWHEKGISTGLNVKQLDKILSSKKVAKSDKKGKTESKAGKILV